MSIFGMPMITASAARCGGDKLPITHANQAAANNKESKQFDAGKNTSMRYKQVSGDAVTRTIGITLKRSVVDKEQAIFSTPAPSTTQEAGSYFKFTADNKLKLRMGANTLSSDRAFRDVAGWYDILVVMDFGVTRKWVNGDELDLTAGSTADTAPNEWGIDGVELIIGKMEGLTDPLFGELGLDAIVERVFVIENYAAQAPEEFGFTDSRSGQWVIRRPDPILFSHDNSHYHDGDIRYEDSFSKVIHTDGSFDAADSLRMKDVGFAITADSDPAARKKFYLRGPEDINGDRALVGLFNHYHATVDPEPLTQQNFNELPLVIGGNRSWWMLKPDPKKGLDVVSYIGTGTTREKFRHNLGKRPSLYMVFNVSPTGVATANPVWVENLTNAESTRFTNIVTDTAQYQYVGYTPHTDEDIDDEYFSVGQLNGDSNSSHVNQLGATYLTYLFTEVPGFIDFIPYRDFRLPTVGVLSWKQFNFKGEEYGFLVNNTDGTSLAVDSKFMKLNKVSSSYEVIHSIMGYSTRSAVMFERDGVLYAMTVRDIGGTNGTTILGAGCTLYHLDNNEMVKIQDIEVDGGWNLTHYVDGTDDYILLASYKFGEEYNLESLNLRFNDEIKNFDVVQRIDTTGVTEINTMEFKGERYAIAPTYYDTDKYGTVSSVMRKDKDTDQFLPIQEIISIGVQSWTMFECTGRLFAISANHTNDSGVYSVNSNIMEFDEETNTFKTVTTVTTLGAYSWTTFQRDGKFYLLLASFYSGTSYAVDSPLYEFNPDDKSLTLVQSIVTEGCVGFEVHEVEDELYITELRHFNGTDYTLTSLIHRWHPVAKRLESETVYLENPSAVLSRLSFAVGDWELRSDFEIDGCKLMEWNTTGPVTSDPTIHRNADGFVEFPMGVPRILVSFRDNSELADFTESVFGDGYLDSEGFTQWSQSVADVSEDNYLTLDPLSSRGGALLSVDKLTQFGGEADSGSFLTGMTKEIYFEYTVDIPYDGGLASPTIVFFDEKDVLVWLCRYVAAVGFFGIYDIGHDAPLAPSSYTVNPPAGSIVGIHIQKDVIDVTVNGELIQSVPMEAIQGRLNLHTPLGAAATFNLGQSAFSHMPTGEVKLARASDLICDVPVTNPIKFVTGFDHLGNGAETTFATPFKADVILSHEYNSPGDWRLYNSKLGWDRMLSTNQPNQASVGNFLKDVSSRGFSSGDAVMGGLNDDGKAFKTICFRASKCSGLELVAYKATGLPNAIVDVDTDTADVVFIKATDADHDWYIYIRQSNSFVRLNQVDAASMENLTVLSDGGLELCSNGINEHSILTNEAETEYLAMLFKRVPGFSDFKLYNATGEDAGTRVMLDVVPKYFMVKPLSIAGPMAIYDTDGGDSTHITEYTTLTDPSELKVGADIVVTSNSITFKDDFTNVQGAEYVIMVWGATPSALANAI